MRIVRGWYHPRGPEDIPAEVDELLEDVADCVAGIDAEASRRAWGG